MMRCSKVSTRAAERHEYLIVGWRSVGLDARELDHLGPFLGFVSDKLSEISGTPAGQWSRGSFEMEAAAMRAITPVTPDEAARVWRRIPNPSARKVVEPLTQAGRRVHFSTIARWRAQGWRPVVSGPHPIEAARDALDRATRLLTGHLPLGADTSVRQSEASDQLASLNDVELLRRSSRELLIRQIGLCKIMSSRGVLLIREKPAETGRNWSTSEGARPRYPRRRARSQRCGQPIRPGTSHRPSEPRIPWTAPTNGYSVRSTKKSLQCGLNAYLSIQLPISPCLACPMVRS